MGASDTIRRVALPKGEWWEIETDPEWGQLKGLASGMDDSALLERLTVAWSFPEAPTGANIGHRRASQMIPVLAVIQADVLPLFEQLAKTKPAVSTPPSGTEG